MNGGPRNQPILGSVNDCEHGGRSSDYHVWPAWPSISIATACTSGVHNIGHAARIIAYGDADVMVAGGAEKASTPLGVGGFGAARAISTAMITRKRRAARGIKSVMVSYGRDGAGMLVLEEYEHAKKRGAKIYAELVGFGMSSDAYHMTSPPENGAGAALAMANALRDAGLKRVRLATLTRTVLLRGWR
ncbi:beta-ketoacyl synthase N-terminal-like domain-containing protein [Escherichia coli]